MTEFAYTLADILRLFVPVGGIVLIVVNFSAFSEVWPDPHLRRRALRGWPIAFLCSYVSGAVFTAVTMACGFPGPGAFNWPGVFIMGALIASVAAPGWVISIKETTE